MHFRHLLAGLGALILSSLALPAFAVPPNISYTVGVCDPSWPTRCTQAGPFVPDALSTVTIATVGTSSLRVALTGTGATVVVNNTGSNPFYVKLGGSTVTAAATDFYVPAGAQIPMARGTATYIAAITASSTSTLVASSGWGTPAGGSGGGSSGGGGTGTASFTAAASPFSVSAGANKPLGISTSNSAAWMVPVKPGTTTEIDLTGPSGVYGVDGATIATLVNPFPTTAALVPGTAIAGKFGIDQTTPGTTNGVQTLTGSVTQETPATSGGLLACTFEVAASDNHQNCGTGAAHQVYAVQGYSIHTAAMFMRLYNSASFNGCNSATNLVWEGQIPAPGTTGGGFTLTFPTGLAFSSGIGVCVTGAFGNTNTTSATASVASVNIQYK